MSLKTDREPVEVLVYGTRRWIIVDRYEVCPDGWLTYQHPVTGGEHIAGPNHWRKAKT